jgi:hypothetical protein
MSNPYESPLSTEMEAASPTDDTNTRRITFVVGIQFAVMACSNQIATFWGLMDPEFRANPSLVASFLVGAAILALFTFGLGTFCGWLTPSRRRISLRTLAITFVSLTLPANVLFLFYTCYYADSYSRHVALNSNFIVMYLTVTSQCVALSIFSILHCRRWAIVPVGGLACALAGGFAGMWYYLMIINGV